MPADPRINMAYQGVQLENPLAVASQGEKLQSQQRENALAQQQMDEYNSPDAQGRRQKAHSRESQTNKAEDIKMVLPSLTSPQARARFGEYMANQYGDNAQDWAEMTDDEYGQLMEGFGHTKKGKSAGDYQFVNSPYGVGRGNKRTGDYQIMAGESGGAQDDQGAPSAPAISAQEQFDPSFAQKEAIKQNTKR